jgi:CheY-like chemotaxis protein
MQKDLKTVLLIEDNQYNRVLERTLLERAGYTVFEAEDAEVGINIARKKLPDIILVDYQLPGMNGIQAMRELKGDSRAHSISCIIVTASATERDIGLFKASDACGYITKPINTRTFVEQIVEFATA